MVKIEIVAAVVAVVTLAILLGLVIPPGQKNWDAGLYVRAIWWYAGAGLTALIGLVATVLPFAYRAEAERKPALSASEIVIRELAEHTALQTRPYIDILGASLDYIGIEIIPSAHVMIKNSGRTPAVDVMVGSRVQIGDFPLFTDTAYEAIDGPRITIGADGQAVTTVRGDSPVTEAEWAGIRSGMKWLKVHGEVVFTSDPPPNVPYKHVHFCFVLNTLASNLLQVCDNFGDHADKGVFR